jgi:sulfatase maturation enzyme AslB (radical SAM superfamily)
MVKCGFFILEENDFPELQRLSREGSPWTRFYSHGYAAQEIPAGDMARYIALFLLDAGIWNMLLRADICRQISFRPLRYEDGYYNLDLSRRIKSLLLLPEVYYIYIQRPGSQLRTSGIDFIAWSHWETVLFDMLRDDGMTDCLPLVYNRGLLRLINRDLGADIPDGETARRLAELAKFYQDHITYLDVDNAVWRDKTFNAWKIFGEPPLPLAEAQYSLALHPANNPCVKKPPKAVRIDPGGKCNFFCYFCPCNNSETGLSMRHQIMPLDLYSRIIDGMSAFGPVDNLELYGYGEPLLNPALPEMIAYAKEKGAARRIGFTTNGFLLRPELNQKLADSGVDSIRISINGLNTAQYESACGVRLDFTAFLRNIADLRLRAKGRARLTAKIVDAALPARDGEAMFRQMFRHLTDSQIIEKVEPIWGDFSFAYVNNPHVSAVAYCGGAEGVCSFPFTDMMVFANGDVGLCCSDWRHATKYGNAHDSSLPELWASEALARIRLDHLTKSRRDIPACRSCQRNGARLVPAAG